MAKKAPAKKAPAKRPAKKTPVQPAVVAPTESIAWRPWLRSGAKAVALIVCGAVAGIWVSGGIAVLPSPRPTVNDCLTVAYAADRVSQIAVLRELAEQPFDGTSDDGRREAGEWFTQNRFKNRASDFSAYTDRVAEAIASNSEDVLAKELEQ